MTKWIQPSRQLTGVSNIATFQHAGVHISYESPSVIPAGRKNTTTRTSWASLPIASNVLVGRIKYSSHIIIISKISLWTERCCLLLEVGESCLHIFLLVSRPRRVSASDFSSVMKTSWIKVHPRQIQLYPKWRISCIIYRMSSKNSSSSSWIRVVKDNLCSPQDCRFANHIHQRHGVCNILDNPALLRSTKITSERTFLFIYCTD